MIACDFEMMDRCKNRQNLPQVQGEEVNNRGSSNERVSMPQNGEALKNLLRESVCRKIQARSRINLSPEPALTVVATTTRIHKMAKPA